MNIVGFMSWADVTNKQKDTLLIKGFLKKHFISFTKEAGGLGQQKGPWHKDQRFVL